MKKKLMTICLCIVMIVTMMPVGIVHGLIEEPSNVSEGVSKVLTLEEALDYAVKNDNLSFSDLKTLLGNYDPAEIFDLTEITDAGGTVEPLPMEKAESFCISNIYDVLYSDYSVESFKGWIYGLNLFYDESASIEEVKANIKHVVESKFMLEDGSLEYEVAVEKYDIEAADDTTGDSTVNLKEKYADYEACARDAGYGLHLDDVYLVELSSKVEPNVHGEMFVTVIDKANVVESISIKSVPDKYCYVLEEDKPDVSGGILEAVYTDGTKKLFPIEEDMLIGFEEKVKTPGQHDIFVMFGGKLTQFEINVTRKPIAIKINKAPEKLDYFVGDEVLDLSGGELALEHEDGSIEVIKITKNMIFGFESVTEGAQNIKVLYGDLETEFEINGEAVKITSVTVNSSPSGYTYYGDKEVNLDGASLKVEYNNGKEDIVSVTPEMISDLAIENIGVQDIYVNYEGWTIPMEIEVLPGDITNKIFTLEYESCTYNGKQIMPAVMCDGLKAGIDYSVEYIDNINVGRATVLVKGIGNYEGEIKLGFDIEKPGIDFILGELNMGRIYGSDRYQTAIKVAISTRLAAGKDKFDTIIVADGIGYADALSGTYLAAVKEAPILTVGKDKTSQNLVAEYIKDNLKKDGLVYILGGGNAVNDVFSSKLEMEYGINVKRLGGLDRYETNLMILDEANVGKEEVLVCSGLGFADSLSASATGKPILLVSDTLTDEQKSYIENLSLRKYYIIGGNRAVSTNVERQIEKVGFVERLTGENRFETSMAVANRFFGYSCKSIVVAYGMNFPDGLSGGPFAYELGVPLLLATSNDIDCVRKYVKEANIENLIALGGKTLISDAALNKIMH